mmetsp:Transcript_15722/g.31334  ORF Transcript_15722/g.31334 Transcript_15722/m.31334 type:complete len:455 (-) Transcript_15722:157-1521(-)
MLAWLQRQREAFGSPFLICCSCVYFAQGFRSITGLCLQLWLKDGLHLEPADMEWLLSLAALPWSVKPLYGLVSDARPVWGLRRKPYLILGALLGAVSWLSLAFLSRGEDINQNVLLALLVCSNLSTALSDVILDAMVAERAAASAKEGGAGCETGTEGEDALQTLCWGSLSIGGLLGSGIGMATASSASPFFIFSITALAPLLSLLAAALLPEKRNTVATSVKLQVTSLISALKQPRIHRPLAFFFLQSALVPSVNQAMLFFSTDVLKFSPEFLAAQGVLAYLGFLLGSVVYSRFISGIAFSSIFFYSQAALVVISLGDLFLVLRLNIALGIPDTAFAVGSDSVATVIGRLTLQPFLVIAARVCPPGCEGALYAFFMSTSNFGSTVSGIFGTFISPYFGVVSGEYGGLPKLLAFRSCCMVIPLFLVHILLRDLSAPTEKISTEEEIVAKMKKNE